MSEWASVPIRELLAETFAGHWGDSPEPSTAHVLRATDIDDEGRITGSGAPRRITPSTIARKRLEDGDTLLEASGGSTDKPVGRVAHFDGKKFQDRAYLCSNFFKTLRSKKEHDAGFVFWKLYWFYRQNQILAFQQQTTGIINLKFDEYLSAPVSIPGSLLQEAKIAQILDTLDTQIRQTEALIAKLERIKQGLLTDLLTRGIDQKGQLRPTPEQAPHLYKDSPLGRVPREWEIASIEKVATKVTNGFVGVATPHYTDSGKGVPYLYGNNVRQDILDLSRVLYVTHSFHRTNHKSQLRPGDMLTVQSGHIGTSAVVPSELPEANCHALIITRFREKVNSRFASLYLNSGHGMKQQRRLFIGSTILHINTSDLALMDIPIPSVEEQSEIVEQVTSIKNRIALEKRGLKVMSESKSGLMDDLLTGRVRVTPLLETTERATA